MNDNENRVNWNLQADSPPGVEAGDILAALHREGRDALSIFPPLTLAHYTQGLTDELVASAQDIMARRGIDERTAKSIATRLVTVGLRHLVNIVEFGYAERVLEERAGLEPLPSSPQPLE